jgi:hypothetical protein
LSTCQLPDTCNKPKPDRTRPQNAPPIIDASAIGQLMCDLMPTSINAEYAAILGELQEQLVNRHIVLPWYLLMPLAQFSIDEYVRPRGCHGRLPCP